MAERLPCRVCAASAGRCLDCGGKRNCPHCGGTGYDPKLRTPGLSGGYRVLCGVCHGTKQCPECGGTGKCPVCGGTGWMKAG